MNNYCSNQYFHKLIRNGKVYLNQFWNCFVSCLSADINIWTRSRIVSTNYFLMDPLAQLIINTSWHKKNNLTWFGVIWKRCWIMFELFIYNQICIWWRDSNNTVVWNVLWNNLLNCLCVKMQVRICLVRPHCEIT